MPTTRSYGDACGIARALDVVGERWALLIVRELLLGPQRFTDLRRSLPGASSNLLTDRLRELDARGVIHRRKLHPPASSWVYDLTGWGRALEPIVLALGEWGLQVPPPPEPAHRSATSMLIYLRAAARTGSLSAVFRVELDERVWTVRAGDGTVVVEPGEPVSPDAAVRTDPNTLNALLGAPSTLDEAIAAGSVSASGDLAALRRLISSVATA